MSPIRTAFIKLHVSVLLAGFTGLFGRLITLDETQIVWYRMLFTSAILLVMTGLPRVSRRELFRLAFCGALLGLHWMLFYGSIKASNISIGVICYSLVGFFTALIEPYLFHRRVSPVELLFSLLTLLGLVLVFSFDSRYRYGISLGVVSAMVAALYGTVNKRVTVSIRNRTALFYEMAAGLVVISAVIPLYRWIFGMSPMAWVVPTGSDLWWMLCHALFCTVGLYLLQIAALRELSAFTVNLTYNLEPCYTILMAFIFFGEARELHPSFYIGIVMILTSVLLQSLRVRRHH